MVNHSIVSVKESELYAILLNKSLRNNYALAIYLHTVHDKKTTHVHVHVPSGGIMMYGYIHDCT